MPNKKLTAAGQAAQGNLGAARQKATVAGQAGQLLTLTQGGGRRHRLVELDVVELAAEKTS